MSDKYKYDVFLSYSSRDEAWAEKFYDDLTLIGYRVFFDRRNLDIGTEWRTDLLRDLEASRNLIQLWTANASLSRWVTEEIARFDTLARADAGRKIIPISLDGGDPHYAHIQGIKLLSGYYLVNKKDLGVLSVDRRVWGRVIDQLDQTLGRYKKRPYMFQVILASTQERMAAIDMDHRPADAAADFGTILRNLKMNHRHILGHYGQERGDWVPFACGRTITSILDDIRESLIGQGAPPFRWASAGNQLWNIGSPNFPKTVRTLKEQPCVIVVDALSLYDRQVYDLNIRLQECVANEYATIMILPPFGARRRDRLRGALEVLAAEFYSSCYSAIFETDFAPKSSSALLPADDLDIQRLLTTAVRTSKQSNRNWATSLSSEPSV